jgi:hypothetical protein
MNPFSCHTLPEQRLESIYLPELFDLLQNSRPIALGNDWAKGAANGVWPIRSLKLEWRMR